MAAGKRLTDPFGVRDTLQIESGKMGIYRLSRLEDQGIAKVSNLPFSIRVLLKPFFAIAMATK